MKRSVGPVQDKRLQAFRFRLTNEEMAQLRDLSARTGLSVDALVEQVVRAYLSTGEDTTCKG